GDAAARRARARQPSRADLGHRRRDAAHAEAARPDAGGDGPGAARPQLWRRPGGARPRPGQRPRGGADARLPAAARVPAPAVNLFRGTRNEFTAAATIPETMGSLARRLLPSYVIKQERKRRTRRERGSAGSGRSASAAITAADAPEPRVGSSLHAPRSGARAAPARPTGLSPAQAARGGHRDPRRRGGVSPRREARARRDGGLLRARRRRPARLRRDRGGERDLGRVRDGRQATLRAQRGWLSPRPALGDARRDP